MEQDEIFPKGIYRDQWFPGAEAGFASASGVEPGEWHSNIVVDRCRMLLSAFMRGGVASGIRFLALGRGNPAWDAVAPIHPPATTSALFDTSAIFVPVQAADMSFLDASGNPSLTPTARLQIKVTLGPGTPAPGPGETAFPLREFGLFGLMGPDRAMIDYVRHPVIHKAPADTLVRTIRLVF